MEESQTLQKIKSDNLQARKTKDKILSSLLTTLVGEIEIVGKNNGNRPTTEEEALKVIEKFKKNAQQTLELSHNNDLQSEIELYSSYLPELLSEEELRKMITNYIENGANNIGSIMKELKQCGFQYDGKLASTIVKEMLK